jgi:hypothetical protein
MDRTRNSKIAPDTPAIVVLTRPNHSALEVVPGPIVAVAILQEGIRMNANIEIDPGLEIDLGLSKVSDSALTMLEGANGVANLPPEVFSKLLDALAEEHLRRFGVQKDMAAMLKVPTRALDADELWHSLRMLGNWLSYSDEASHRDPDLGAVSEVIARMWLGMRVALSLVTDGSGDENRCEDSN